MLSTSAEKFLLNVKDEILGLKKDLIFLDYLQQIQADFSNINLWSVFIVKYL